jgi:hypothetical protein
VAYIYFGYKDQTQQRLLDIISIFTKQLLSQLPDLPPDIEPAYDRASDEYPSLETLKHFLFSMPGNFASAGVGGGRVYIVCDALDEMHKHNQRQELLPIFHDMKRANSRSF